MDVFEFVASLVNSLAWPVAAVVLGALFRAELSQLLGRLTGIKLPGGGQASFATTLDKAEVSAGKFERALPPAVRAQRAAEAAEDEVEAAEDELVGRDPTARVIQAWETLSASIMRLRSLQSRVGRPPKVPGVALHHLLQDGVVNESFTDAVRELFELRNRVAHARELPTSASADVYARTARSLAGVLDTLSAIAETKAETTPN